MMPHVLLVSHEASRTGAPRVAAELVAALQRLGYEITVVHRWGGPMRPTIDGHATASRLEPAARLRALLRRSARTKPAARLIERRAIRRVLRTVRPDLVLCNTLLSAPYATAGLDAGVPTILFSHESTEFGRSALERSGLVARTGSSFLTLAACSAAARRCLAEWTGVAEGRIVTLQPCVSVAEVGASAQPSPIASAGRPIVVGCGTANHLKGVDVFRAAAAASEGIDWYWVGANPDGLEDEVVTFVGEVEVTAPWIAMADVFVLPSRHDSFPIVVLEAMALGRPIVASDLEGPREQLGDAARYVAATDADALGRAVGELVGDREAAHALGGAAAQRCAEHWDIGAFDSRLVSAIEAALSRPDCASG